MDSADIKVRAFAAAFSLLLVVVAIARVSSAAFTDTTDNGPSTFNAGDVTITDDDDGNVMFEMQNMGPGSTATRCINVTYSGTLQADVVLYGTDNAGGLEDYLDLTIERSTGAAGGATFDCTGFVDAGATPIWNPATGGTIGAFTTAHANYGTGTDSRTLAGSSNDVASYRFTVTLQDNDLAQGGSSAVSFTWHARTVVV